MAGEDVTYPPLDTLKPVAGNLWIVDSGPQHAGGMSLPVRMSVIRLGNGDMWLHSPTRFTEGLRREIEALGPIRHLIAPNVAHWTHVKEWQTHCPDAETSAAPNLRQRSQVQRQGVRLDRDLTENPPEAWAGEIEQAIVPGGMGFREVAFLHKPTRTLLLTDLVQNLETGKLPLGTRLFAMATRATGGTTPAYIRLALRLRSTDAKTAAERLVAWSPERVIFGHGHWFEQNGTAQLRRALSWLLE